MNGQDARGRFTPGNKLGKGRPAKARELAYLAVAREVVTLQDWRSIVTRAKLDALGSRAVDTPAGTTVENDPDSDSATRERGRRFIADFIIGKLTQPISFDGDLADVLDGLDDADVARIIAEAEAIVSTGAGEGSAADPGAGGQVGDATVVAPPASAT